MTHCEAPKFATTSQFMDYSTKRICQRRPGSPYDPNHTRRPHCGTEENPPLG
jgi:hypothetical protein